MNSSFSTLSVFKIALGINSLTRIKARYKKEANA